MRPLRICLCASEVAPFAKTGGLADVAAGLGRHLGRAGHDVRLVMPMYGRVARSGRELTPVAGLQDLPMRLGERDLHWSVSTVPLPQSDVAVWLVRCPELYGGDAVYGDGPDEAVRFGLLTRAAIELCQRQQWAPDVFHCNDWHTALLPLWLRTGFAWDRLFAAAKTLLTIHNIGYQGVFGLDVLDRLGLAGEQHLLDADDTRGGVVNFLRTGVRYADALTTVSRTYAAEIQTDEYGMGLQAQLRARRDVLRGIVNGVDYGDWDPAHDPAIPAHYRVGDLAGKATCKRALLEQFGLRYDAAVPLLGVVSRLTGQKGFELIGEVLPVLLQQRPVQLAALGSGEEKYERFFQWLRDQWPDKVIVYRGYNDELAHRIEAAADVFLMPSRYEPCGLNQMYSLRYGTVPVVRKTGGLADTVTPWDPATRTGTGFLFEPFDGNALLAAVEAALQAFADRRGWARLQRNGMGMDFSWDVQGQEYEALYRELAGA